MITRIEIDGFKTFRKFQMDFSPLTVIAGANASGKSNLFDALQLLSRLAETDLKTAFSEQRGEASELFTQYAPGEYVKEMWFAVEMLVERHIKDNWGGEAELKYTRLRYELTIRRDRNERGMEDLFVDMESLVNLKHDKDKWVREHIAKSKLDEWRPKVTVGKRGKPYIYTEKKGEVVTIFIPQDGKRGGKETPANAVAQTVLSGINSVDFPHAFAAKLEMGSWKFLQLNPQELQKPSPYLAKDVISQHGENLASALHRILRQDGQAKFQISRRLGTLIPNMIGIQVEDDAANKQFVLKIISEDGRMFSSRVLSEGTLRLLTFCVLLYDDKHKGLICFEEPENGVHPTRLKDLAKLLKDLSVDFSDQHSQLRQVIVNTHSPVLLGQIFNLKDPDRIGLWFSSLVTQIFSIEQKKVKMQVSKILPVMSSSQIPIPFTEAEKRLTINEAIQYLQTAEFDEAIQTLNEP